MTTFNLSAETVSTVVETLKAQVGVDKKWVIAADSLRAEGCTSEILSSDKDYRAAFKQNVILLTFSKTDQAIKAKPHTSLSDEEKVTKRWIDQQLGSRLKRVVEHIKKAEREEQMTDEERGARRVADMEVRLKRDLTVWIEKIQKAEAVKFSAVKMIQHLSDAVALIK